MVQAITLAVIINAYLTFSLGILFNFLLYYLAKKHSTNDLKEYFRITVYHICWHLLQIISQTIGQPLFFIASDNNAYVFLHGPGRWIPSIPLQLLVLVVYLCTLGCSTTSISLQFIDRYLVICRNHSNHFRRYSIMGFIVLLNALVIIIVNICSLPSVNYQLTLQKFVKICGILFGNAQNVEFLQSIRIIWSSDYDNLIQKAFLGLMIISVVFFNIAIIFCYKKIKSFLIKNLKGSWSSLSCEALNQVLRNMLLQAILAALTSLSMLIFVTLAVSGIFSVIILPFELLLFLPSQWLPVLNPLITIITVHKYRIGFKKLIGLKVFKENSNKQTPVVLPMMQTNNENVVVQERCITPLRNELCQIDRTYN
uniref:Uncharacterized protein n=1 Tax=Meloidogyne enterolobii TaxID=390850 RepID=A0A6V7U0J8_MELEN|nr:unnamed protein product [Meloidogyne enterolobii]